VVREELLAKILHFPAILVADLASFTPEVPSTVDCQEKMQPTVIF
jgi:hypothetical protein